MSFSHLSFLLAASLTLPGVIFAQTYTLRAETRDNVTALTGRAKQGSFGAPAINDNGEVAYTCVLSGNGVGGTTSYGIIFKGKSKNATPKLILQSGIPRGQGTTSQLAVFTLSNSFLLDPDDSKVYPVNGSGYMFRLSKDVALNNSKVVAFAGETVWVQQTDTFNDAGEVESSDTVDRRTASYGAVLAGAGYYTNPRGIEYGNAEKKTVQVNGVDRTVYEPYDLSGELKNIALNSYVSYFSDILRKTVSINTQNATVYNASFIITPEESFPGFAWSSPSGELIVATTASNAIGLPFFTTFQSFTDAVIADKNRCFVVADLSDAGDEFDGIWQGNNSNLQPVTVRGRPSPAGGQYASFDGIIGPSRSGNLVSFIADVTDGRESRGVFRTNLKGEDGRLIAAVGDSAPGTDEEFQNFELAGVSNRGHVVFVGVVPPEANGSRSRLGIWITDPKGSDLKLIALEGGNLPVGKKTKQITRLTFNPISGINKKGEVAFTASFTDRTSAVFIAR